MSNIINCGDKSDDSLDDDDYPTRDDDNVSSESASEFPTTLFRCSLSLRGLISSLLKILLLFYIY